MVELRDYQLRAIEAVHRYYEEHSGNCIIVAPTGAGKSLIIGGLCRDVVGTWPDQRMIVLSHVRELIQQDFDKIRLVWPDAPVGIYCAGLGEKSFRNGITVASIQSVHKKAHLFGWQDVLLIDECHLLSPESNTMYRKFIDALRRTNPRLIVIGLSASPYRLKTGSLTEGENRLFTDIAYEISMLELLDAGYICPMVGKSSVIQADMTGVRTTAGEWNAADMEKAVDQDALTRAALDEVFELASDRRSWLVFCSGVKHAGHVRDAIRERGARAEVVTGDTPKEERDATLAAFKAGTLQCAVSVGVLTTGFDAPNVDLIIFLRGTKSPGLFLQMAGRGMRIGDTKKNCLLLDYCHNLETFGPLTHIQAPDRAKRRGVLGERHKPACLICPQCRMASPLDALECADCGHSFEKAERIKHEAEASMAEVMRLTREPARVGEWVDVTGVRYARHKKPDKPDSLRVEYQCGLVVVKEWVCLQHNGYAKSKAVKWFNDRVPLGITIPASVAERLSQSLIEIALDQQEHIKPPSRILVKPNGKYLEILAYDFNRPSDSQSLAG